MKEEKSESSGICTGISAPGKESLGTEKSKKTGRAAAELHIDVPPTAAPGPSDVLRLDHTAGAETTAL